MLECRCFHVNMLRFVLLRFQSRFLKFLIPAYLLTYYRASSVRHQWKFGMSVPENVGFAIALLLLVMCGTGDVLHAIRRSHVFFHYFRF